MKKTDFQFSVFVGKVSQRLLPITVLNRRVHLAGRPFSGPPMSLLKRL